METGKVGLVRLWNSTACWVRVYSCVTVSTSQYLQRDAFLSGSHKRVRQPSTRLTSDNPQTSVVLVRCGKSARRNAAKRLNKKVKLDPETSTCARRCCRGKKEIEWSQWCSRNVNGKSTSRPWLIVTAFGVATAALPGSLINSPVLRDTVRCYLRCRITVPFVAWQVLAC